MKVAILSTGLVFLALVACRSGSEKPLTDPEYLAAIDVALRDDPRIQLDRDSATCEQIVAAMEAHAENWLDIKAPDVLEAKHVRLGEAINETASAFEEAGEVCRTNDDALAAAEDVYLVALRDWCATLRRELQVDGSKCEYDGP